MLVRIKSGAFNRLLGLESLSRFKGIKKRAWKSVVSARGCITGNAVLYEYLLPEEDNLIK